MGGRRGFGLQKNKKKDIKMNLKTLTRIDWVKTLKQIEFWAGTIIDLMGVRNGKN
jgi:hypothetical protein